MKNFNIGLIGYGRMGHAVEEVLLAQGHSLAWTSDAGISAEELKEKLGKTDVVIEFTRPEAALANILLAIETGTPIVTGTTGWYGFLPQVRKACEEQNASVFYAPNFSIGVHLFAAINRYAASLMKDYPDYGVSIRETHHTAKLDAPSGTAIRLAQELLQEYPKLTSWVEGEQREPDQLPVLSFREPDVPGTHEIRFSGKVDEIRLEHIAHSRTGFARGAVQAASWLPGRKGLFTMADMLGI
jgi:4-hydroxy-tetrahydrodipicolinate reductase